MKLGNYLVKFYHQNNTYAYFQFIKSLGVKSGRSQTPQPPEPSFTECRIFNVYDTEANTALVASEYQIGIGVAKVHNGDNYCKEKGRRISLVRAMKSAGIDKENRTEMWEDYRLSSPVPKWGKPLDPQTQAL